MTTQTRRAFLLAGGGGAAGATIGWWAGTQSRLERAGAPAPVSSTPDIVGNYVDYDGWMVSPEEARRLAGEPGGEAR